MPEPVPHCFTCLWDGPVSGPAYPCTWHVGSALFTLVHSFGGGRLCASSRALWTTGEGGKGCSGVGANRAGAERGSMGLGANPVTF